ncbi:hypothetical protein P7K49_008172 [Saguinus oedipus]|uniref:Uncharacterized protein n=1 Tax=Saguinus oedipus TaxID=9490 RepID=A0ABQ9VWY1_SAGOE|nr:hypothetical protein P7K49_008172 [Saguinus oedipus]
MPKTRYRPLRIPLINSRRRDASSPPQGNPALKRRSTNAGARAGGRAAIVTRTRPQSRARPKTLKRYHPEATAENTNPSRFASENATALTRLLTSDPGSPISPTAALTAPPLPLSLPLPLPLPPPPPPPPPPSPPLSLPPRPPRLPFPPCTALRYRDPPLRERRRHRRKETQNRFKGGAALTGPLSPGASFSHSQASFPAPRRMLGIVVRENNLEVRRMRCAYKMPAAVERSRGRLVLCGRI